MFRRLGLFVRRDDRHAVRPARIEISLARLQVLADAGEPLSRLRNVQLPTRVANARHITEDRFVRTLRVTGEERQDVASVDRAIGRRLDPCSL